jgi:hypothetical protein
VEATNDVMLTPSFAGTEGASEAFGAVLEATRTGRVVLDRVADRPAGRVLQALTRTQLDLPYGPVTQLFVRAADRVYEADVFTGSKRAGGVHGRTMGAAMVRVLDSKADAAMSALECEVRDHDLSALRAVMATQPALAPRFPGKNATPDPDLPPGLLREGPPCPEGVVPARFVLPLTDYPLNAKAVELLAEEHDLCLRTRYIEPFLGVRALAIDVWPAPTALSSVSTDLLI